MNNPDSDLFETLFDAYFGESDRQALVDAIRVGLSRGVPQWVLEEFQEAVDDHLANRTAHFREKIFPRPRTRGKSPNSEQEWVHATVNGHGIHAPRELALIEAIDVLRRSGCSVEVACKHPDLDAIWRVSPETRKKYYLRFRKRWGRKSPISGA